MLGVFLLGWGALTDVLAISVIGMVAMLGALVFRLYWWLKKSSGK